MHASEAASARRHARFPLGLTREEEREACRAFKGSMLRQEVYALDGTDEAEASVHRH